MHTALKDFFTQQNISIKGLFSCGRNDYGQLGVRYNDSNNRNYLTNIGSVSNWTGASCYNTHTLMLNSSGELYSCGRNYYGELGLGFSSTTAVKTIPTRVGLASNWSKISTGASMSFAINSSGELYAWGDNSNGKLGFGDTTDRDEPTQIGSASNWSLVDSGGYHTMAINSSGELYSWGGNADGQLGLGDETYRDEPIRVGSASDWEKIALGINHTLMINSSGELYSCGANDYGQLGLGDNTDRNVPTRVGAASNWTQIAARGEWCSFALNSSGELYAWGRNAGGQLGLGDETDRDVPVRVGSASDWTQISRSRAINSSGELYAWGSDYYGQLGLGGDGDCNAPARVGTSARWTFIHSGTGSVTFGIKN